MADLMPIGQFSKSCRLSIKALRHYDQLGLLVPAHVDEVTGYRYYDASQVRLAIVISMLRGLEVPLPVIRTLLEGTPDQISAILSAERDRFHRELAKKQIALATIDRLVRSGSLLPYQIETRTEPDRLMLGMSITTNTDRHVTDSMELADRLFSAMKSAGLPVLNPIIGRVRMEEETMHVDMLAPIESEVPLAGASVVRLAGGPVAWTLHQGAYEELGLAHHALFAWVRQHGHSAATDILEIYVNDPTEVAPESLLTEVLMPLA